MQLSSAVIPSLVAALIYWVFFYVGENYNKLVWLCRRRLPEKQMLKGAETCLFPTGSVSHTLDRCKLLPFVVTFFHGWSQSEERQDWLTKLNNLRPDLCLFLAAQRSQFLMERARHQRWRRRYVKREHWKTRTELEKHCPKTSRRKDPETQTRTFLPSRNVS